MVHRETLIPAANYVAASKHLKHIRWIPPPLDAYKLNTNGSHRVDTQLSACGGLIRDHMGTFIAGFHCNLGTATSVLAELGGLVHGLKLAQSLHLQRIIVELDSEVVISMIRMRRSLSLYPKPLLDEALVLIDDTGWICSVNHTYREGNRSADCLANLGHYGPLSCTRLERVPPQLSLCLEEDVRGVLFLPFLSQKKLKGAI